MKEGADLGDVMFGGFEWKLKDLQDEILSAVKDIEKQYGKKRETILSYLVSILIKEISSDPEYTIVAAVSMIAHAREKADKEGKPWASKLLPIAESLAKFEEENITRIKGEKDE